MYVLLTVVLLFSSNFVVLVKLRKSRVSGRPGRRPPTRGKRVVGLAKPTYEDKPKIVWFFFLLCLMF